MRPCNVRGWAFRRQSEGKTARDPGAARRAVLAACGCCLPLFLLLLAVGCSHRLTSTKYVEVTGKVLYKGKPLPGGRITFVAVAGGFAGTGNIGQDGQYKVEAPIGDVQIGVDNSMLRQGRGAPHGPIASPEMMKRSGGEKDQVTGTYVPIPEKYQRPESSGLTYTVKSETQTHEVTLE
jgi:hypothetical protein